MNEIKSMIIYMDNSCEVQFGSSVDDSTDSSSATRDSHEQDQQSSNNSKILLSPCGSEFLYRSYSIDNTIQKSLKYRTAYPISSLASKIRCVLQHRNRHSSDLPFISPHLLVESDDDKKSSWISSEMITQVKWNQMTSKIQLDKKSLLYTWKSECGRAEIKIHFNKKLALAVYPVRVPRPPAGDELLFSQKIDSQPSHQSKYLHKYTRNEQEFSMNHLPPAWARVFVKMLELIENKVEQNNEEFVVDLPEAAATAMPLSCNFTHMHKFDQIDTLSEPKVLYVNQTWFKLFHKTKSIEIFCPNASKETPTLSVVDDSTSCQEYFVSDDVGSGGRFYTSYSVNKTMGEVVVVEETKLCVDNVPSFKTHTRRVLAYAGILMRRVDSIRQISNYTSCYTLKKLEEIESLCTTSQRVKWQQVVENIGHFKQYTDQSILVNFADRARIYMDARSVTSWSSKRECNDDCYLSLYLPDSSQHEICVNNRSSLSELFKNYLSFLDQWIDWIQKEEHNL